MSSTNTNLNTSSSINRSFRDLSDVEVADIERASALTRMGWTGGFGWDELLLSRRVILVSEAGAGKTYECQTQQARLWKAGEPAFFLELATLAGCSARDMLSHDEEKRFDAWLRSQSGVATFFLDSYDELKLTLGNFDQALRRLNKAIAGQLSRARIVVTSRPVPIDRELIAEHLPIPYPSEVAPTAEAFADRVMDRPRNKLSEETGPKPWRNVSLMPLSLEQMRIFARIQGVADPDALLADIRGRDAQEFAERPQDLIELCSDWREHQRIRSHREQVETNIAAKLRPRTDRKEKVELSHDSATDGASRLALAALLSRKLTLRYSADTDSTHTSEAALDVSKVLLDWGNEGQSVLLERSLFGFASYGRVRFHHRSVLEFLAAKRLNTLLDRGVSIKSIKRSLFVETAQGTRTVRPSMRPVAAWLALSRPSILDEVISLDPAVVLNHGDPQSLGLPQRIRALEAYVNRYGRGSWRGLRTPAIQVQRFTSPELALTVRQLWEAVIENPEVRNLLLEIIAAGKLKECADIAYGVAMDGGLDVYERSLAIEALVELNDDRLGQLTASLDTDAERWPDVMARRALIALFPRHLPVSRLTSLLARVKEHPRSIGEINHRLPHEIDNANLSPRYLDELRQALTGLILDGVVWDRNKHPHLRTLRYHLLPALVAACGRQAADGIRSEAWTMSSLLALRLAKDDYLIQEKVLVALRHALAELPSHAREAAFWKEDTFLEGLRKIPNAWDRIFDLTYRSGIQLGEKDAAWVRRRLAHVLESADRREMMLYAEMNLLHGNGIDHRVLLESLKPLVADSPALTKIVEDRMKPQKGAAAFRRMEAEREKQLKQAERRTAKAHASWVMFWREIAQNPDAVFTPDRAENTAWNLWEAIERSGEMSRASGWNRRYIEEQFGKKVADRLRETMMVLWRKDRPTLRSEREDDKKGTFLVRWQFGLAGIAAESEDPTWAKRLTGEEAELACRYAPIELSGFPSWFESLAVEHPQVIDRILGQELTHSFSEGPNASSMLLQDVSHAPAIVVALFVPRIRAWLTEIAQPDARPNAPQNEQNLRQAVEILVRSGNDYDRRFIEEIAKQHLGAGLVVPFAKMWLRTLLSLNPSAGVDALEKGTTDMAIAKLGTGVQLFADLFGRDHDGLGFDLQGPEFGPSLLLRLLRLSYGHVRLEHDEQHEGSYTPGTRDHAERGRNAILSALFAAPGPEGWAAKMEMANDPLFAHIKDRAIALAEEKTAEEADSGALTEAEFAILDKTGESPPKTRDAMFALMRDRLDDIDDLLVQETSPRELWAGVTDEHVMRRELARALGSAARQSYTIDQEAVTADEKETDLRFRSTGSEQQGVIELKLGDERSGTDLFNTIRDQLLTKYMAPDNCRVGCLLVTITKDREWEHPKTRRRIGFDELMTILSEEAERISKEFGGTVRLMARGLDLRPRLPTERKSRRGER